MRVIIIVFFILLNFIAFCQSTTTMNLPQPVNFTNGTYNFGVNYDNINFYGKIKNNAEVELHPEQEILFGPDAEITNFNGNGNLYAHIDSKFINVASFSTNASNGDPWSVLKYDKFELGVTLPQNIIDQINNFFNGNTGLNPYDPDQIRVECNFIGYNYNTQTSSSYNRYGFYYKDFEVQNNTWFDKATDYLFRIRFSPPQDGSYKANIKIYLNGALYETVTRDFNVFNSSNPGHLIMANGNFRKMKFSNGPTFFAIGQNVGYIIPSQQPNSACFECITPYDFERHKNIIDDIANNGGNFVRFRLDNISGLAEWPDQKMLSTDPNPDPNKPLNSFLNNYENKQRFLWEVDRMFNTMEERGVYCMLNILNDQSFAVDNVYDPNHNFTWSKNPYNSVTGIDNNGCRSFFTNSQSKLIYKKWLYYVMARWGYSTNLGIWEMINETSGIANDNSLPTPYNSDSNFANDVNNWVCEMKSYLEGFYPWHPTTNGNTGEDNLSLPPCLNIWSANQYGTFIDNNGIYSDINYNPRWNKSNFFHSQYQPFIFGELGIADGANFIDKYNDRTFHNTLWTTSMMGGIGAGLYWNDWLQEGGVNHRYNFNALRSFIANQTDLNKTFELKVTKDWGVSSLSDREIHTFYMKETNKEYVIGWAQNNSSNWTVDYPSLPTIISPYPWDNNAIITSPQLALDKTGFDGNIQSYSCFSTNQNPYMKVEFLKTLRRYKVKIFDTYQDGELLEEKYVTTNAAGALLFRRYMPNSINRGALFNPDYAFIATFDPIINWCLFCRNPNQASDTIDIKDADTLCLDPTFVNDPENYKYSWKFGNGQSSLEANPCVNYSHIGNYSLEVTYTNIKTDSSSTLYKTIVVVNSNIINRKNVLAFPSPANNHVFLEYDETKIINPKIEITDVLGRIHDCEFLSDKTINVSKLPTGIYFIKFTSEDYDQTIKISVSH